MVKFRFSHHNKFVTEEELWHGDESMDLHKKNQMSVLLHTRRGTSAQQAL